MLKFVFVEPKYFSKIQEMNRQDLVETVLCYGEEVWILNMDWRKRVMAVEVDYLKRSVRVSRKLTEE